MAMKFPKWCISLLLLISLVSAKSDPGLDSDGDGKLDAHSENIIVLLRAGVEPDEQDTEALSTGAELQAWKAKSPKSEYGKLLHRLGNKGSFKSASNLTARREKNGTGRSRRTNKQILIIKNDSSKKSLGAALRDLSEDAAVESAEPDFLQEGQLNDPYFLSSGSWGQTFADQWYLQTISAPTAWPLVPANAPQIVVAVIDSGIDRTHPDIANVIWTNGKEIPGNGIDDDKNGYVDDVYGWNFASGNNNTLDTHGHGTIVAGLIGAKQDNAIGIAGAAPGTRLMALRNGESGSSYVSRSIESVYYAVQNGAKVINMSFGGANYSAAFDEAVRYAVDHNVVLVAAAGNASSESYTTYPACYSGVISVGATDHLDQTSGYSNFGPTIDLVAPGGGGGGDSGQTMLSCRASGTTLGVAVGTQYIRSSGTSFASPLVAATAALLLRNHPDLTPAHIQQILVNSSDDIDSPGWSLKSSFGRLNMQRALGMAAPAIAEIDNVTNGQVVSGSLTVHGTAKAPTFTEYALEYGQGKTPTAWTQIIRGTQAVDEGILGTWSTTGLPGGEYTLRLTVSAANGIPSGQCRLSVFIGVQSPTSRAGWPISLINMEEPTVMDLNGDGIKEVIVPAKDAVRVYQPNGAIFRAGSYNGVLAWPSGPVGVGDIDGDGEMEIGLISKSGASTAYPEFCEVRFWNLDGSTCAGWPISLPRPNDFVPHTLAPTLIDVDGDRICEVLFPSVTAKNGYPTLHLVRGNGQPMPGWPKTLTSTAGSYIHCTTGAGDVNGDGKIDFVVADSSGVVHALDLSGNYLPGWPKTIAPGSHIFQEVAITDLDRDGKTDVVACFYGGNVAVLNRNGTFKTGWPKTLGGIPKPPAIADLDGDGYLELAIGMGSSVHLLNYSGQALPGWPKQVSNWSNSPTLVDLNNDGSLDIVASDGNRTLHAWTVNGTYFSELGFPFQLPGSFGCYSSAIPEDLDGDGLLELIVEGQSLEVRNLAAIANPRALPFTHLHCDPANTCRYVLPGRIIKGQKFIADRSGGTTLDLSGFGLLEGSSIRIGNVATTAESLSSTSLDVQVPTGLQAGWHDITISNPNSSSTWLANSVLVVDDLFGDTDADALSDSWEWMHGFDPLASNPAGSASAALGDADGDGICNLVEAAFEAMGLDPNRSDASALPLPQFSNGRFSVDYRHDSREKSKITLAWSPDLVQWFKPGDAGYPANTQDIDLGTGTGTIQNRRITLPIPNTGAGYVRWLISR